MEKSLKSKAKPKSNKIKTGDVVVLGLVGIFKVEGIEEVLAGGQGGSYLVLSNLFSQAIHKTYVPLDRAETLVRDLTGRQSKSSIQRIIEGVECDLEFARQNSNKKIKHFEDKIKIKGFRELLRSYFIAKQDVETNNKSDKRFVAFKERLRRLIIEEISAANQISVGESDVLFSFFDRIQTTH